MAYQASVYKPKDVSGALPEYEAMRRKLQQQNTAQVQGQQDALQRRFAALGQSNSGAAIKQDQLTQQQGADNLQQGMEDIGDKEAAARRQMQDVEDQRAFQSQEAEQGRSFTADQNLRGQQFQAGESEKQRGFTTGERLAGQQFQAGESEKGRQFTSGENKLQREQQSQFHADELGMQNKQLDWQKLQGQMQNELQKKQLAIQQQESDFSMGAAYGQMDDDERQRAQAFTNSLQFQRENPGQYQDIQTAVKRYLANRPI